MSQINQEAAMIDSRRPQSGLWVLLFLAATMSGCSNSDSSDEADEPSSAASSETVSADALPNAADSYNRIAARMGKGFMDPLAELSATSPPTGSEARFLVDHQDLIAEIIAATKVPSCDFHIDLSRGFDILVPHLASMRSMAKLLQFDAHRLLVSPAGSRDAADRLAAMIRLAQHSGRDPMLIDKLVCMSILGLACDSVVAWKSKIPSESRKAILAELETIKSQQLFDIQPVANQELMAARVAIESGQSIEMPGRGTVAIAASERAGILKEVERVHRDVEAAWDRPDAERAIAKSVESVKDPKAKFFIVSWDTYRKQCSKVDDQINKAIAAAR